MWDERFPFSLSEIYDLYCYCVVCWPTRGKTDADGKKTSHPPTSRALTNFYLTFVVDLFGIFDFPYLFFWLRLWIWTQAGKLRNSLGIHSNIVENSRQNKKKVFHFDRKLKDRSNTSCLCCVDIDTNFCCFLEISHCCCHADGLSMNNLCISFSSMQKLQLNYPNILLCFLASLSLVRLLKSDLYFAHHPQHKFW